MALTTGTRFDHYEILSHLGAGGMGEVYRARDTKLGRDVAFKVLPQEFATDPDRLLRFQREGQLLASLNHPNIAQIYGVVEADRTRGIVMEFVEGETLQLRLKRGALPIDEAVAIAKQVAEAMEAAHERGVIHRDLKPGNIMIDVEGRVKVLDFGLAKALEPQGSESSLASSPTLITAIPTSANVLIGTAAYMSPEQVRGRAASESSDVWAFGCVLFEALTGRPAFAGDTVADVIGAIVRIDPDWTLLPSDTPPALVALLKRCLEKERRRRYHAIGDVRLDLEEPQSAPTKISTATSKSRERIAWASAVLFAVIAVLLLFMVNRPASVQPAVSRFSIELPTETTLTQGAVVAAPYPAISPDGRYLVFALPSSSSPQRLWLRPIDSTTSQVIPGTEGVAQYPFWSPDSKFIGFVAAGKLKKVPVAGGTPQTLCDASAGGATWSQDDLILFEREGAIHRVSAAGGSSTPIRTPNKSKNESSYRWPEFLPGGKSFIYLAVGAETQRLEVRAASLDSTDDRPLLTSNSRVLYANSGHLLFANNGTLMAQPFDARRMKLNGDAFPVAERVAMDDQILSGSAAFTVSREGTLIYRSNIGNRVAELTWFDRSGKRLGSEAANTNSVEPFISPDQNRVAINRIDSNQTDIWVTDLLRGTNLRLTSDPANDTYPVFSSDGKQIVFLSNRGGAWGLYMKDATGRTGTEELIQKVQGPNDHPNDWSPDGKTLLYVMNGDLWALSMTGERKSYPVLNQTFNERRARFSPDGRWILYTSNETGRGEIYVQPFPPTGAKWQVSVDGSFYGHWTRGGKEIVYNASANKTIMSVDVKPGATTFEAGKPKELFQMSENFDSRWDVTTDGQRFIFALVREFNGPVVLTTVLNWTANIKK